MNKEQMLLLKVAEECAEVGQICSKAIRFGAHNWGPGHGNTNIGLIKEEMIDLLVSFGYLLEHMGEETVTISEEIAIQRRERIDKYLEVSKQLGILT